jgi:hypothetical protein
MLTRRYSRRTLLFIVIFLKFVFGICFSTKIAKGRGACKRCIVSGRWFRNGYDFWLEHSMHSGARTMRPTGITGLNR